MQIKQLYVVILFILFAHLSLKAQNYNGSVGFRVGYGWGLTGKYFIGGQRGNGHAIEGILRYGYHGVVFTPEIGVYMMALYQKHWTLGRSERWSVLLGGGTGIGLGKVDKQKVFALGIAPVFGFDVLLRRLPINFTFDYKPTLFFDHRFKQKGIEKIDKEKFTFYEFALSFRYAFTGKRRR